MTTFNDRENAYESKFAHDQETQFKITARRNKLLGLWAADKMHMKGESRDVYARSIVEMDLNKVGDGDVLHKLLADFEKAGISITEKDIRAEMHELLDAARQQISG